MDTPRSDRLLSTAELAEHLGVSVATVHRMRRMGEIPVIKIRNFMFRFDLGAVLEALKSGTPTEKRDPPLSVDGGAWR